MNISSIFQVRDGSISSSPLLGTYCGNGIPPPLQSTQRSMYIRFKTDSSVSNHGFEAAYGSALEGENNIFSIMSAVDLIGNFLLTSAGLFFHNIVYLYYMYCQLVCPSFFFLFWYT